MRPLAPVTVNSYSVSSEWLFGGFMLSTVEFRDEHDISIDFQTPLPRPATPMKPRHDAARRRETELGSWGERARRPGRPIKPRVQRQRLRRRRPRPPHHPAWPPRARSIAAVAAVVAAVAVVAAAKEQRRSAAAWRRWPWRRRAWRHALRCWRRRRWRRRVVGGGTEGLRPAVCRC